MWAIYYCKNVYAMMQIPYPGMTFTAMLPMFIGKLCSPLSDQGLFEVLPEILNQFLQYVYIHLHYSELTE